MSDLQDALDLINSQAYWEPSVFKTIVDAARRVANPEAVFDVPDPIVDPMTFLPNRPGRYAIVRITPEDTDAD